MSTEAILHNKVKLLFAKISDPNYVLDNYYGDALINKFSTKSDPDVELVIMSPLLSDLIILAMENMDAYHITVKVFVTRILAIISYNELHFNKIISKRGEDIARAFSAINSPEINPSLKVAYMELALAIVNHCSGIVWLLQTETWQHILALPNEKQTVFVVRQTYKFASQFLWKLDHLKDEANITNVLGVILKPLFETDFLQISSMSSEEEEQHAKALEPMINFIIAILNNNAEKYKQKTILVSVLINKYNLPTRLLSVNDLLHKEELLLSFCKSIFWLMSVKVFLVKPATEDTVYDKNDLLEITAIYFNLVQAYLQRRAITSILDFCNACNVIWWQIWEGKGPTITRSNGTTVEMQSQLVFLPLIPLLYYIKPGMGKSPFTDNWITQYVNVLFNSSCEHTARAAYGMRDVLNNKDIIPITLQCVKRLAFLKNYINDEQAQYIFKSLFFVLRDYDPKDDHGELKMAENYEDTAEKMVIMTYVMDTILLMIKNFNINWQFSIEVVCLYTIVSECLKKPNLSTKFIVSSLNVIAVTVKKFQPPNLSLLMDTPSAIHGIGQLIYMRLHDMHWEIRDSALELLLVVTEISFVKFPPFQKQITDNNLIDVAATMALHDTEPYVQASALRALAAASKMQSVWELLLRAHPDIQEQLISILRNNPEGIVRKEAALVLCELQRNVQLTPNYTNALYQHMVSSALTDFHWEVQIAALKLLKGVISSKLSEQGMLDGTFPAVTFSKEKRKIVTLTDKEIQKRLVKALDDLSAIGCLTVLVLLLHEDTEIEIMEHALNVSQDLMKILTKYNVQEVLGTADEEIESLSEIVTKIKTKIESNATEDMDEGENKSDTVIEGILNSNDVNLLANIFQDQLNHDEKTVEPKLRIEKFVSPSMFVTFLKSKDFKCIIEQKRQWNIGIRSLSSLLDDALGIYEVSGEVNSLDCY